MYPITIILFYFLILVNLFNRVAILVSSFIFGKNLTISEFMNKKYYAIMDLNYR